jgi:hypothetical protein
MPAMPTIAPSGCPPRRWPPCSRSPAPAAIGRWRAPFAAWTSSAAACAPTPPAADPARQQAAANRARRRHRDAPPARLAFRAPGPRWPRWILTRPAGEPVFDDHGRLQVDADQRPPAPGSLSYRLVVRDAYLRAGRQPPLEVDGRWEMKLRDEGHLPPSGYSATRPLGVDPELLELARLSAIPLRTLQRWTPDRREHELARLRAEHAAIQRAEREAFLARLADLHLDAEPRS